MMMNSNARQTTSVVDFLVSRDQLENTRFFNRGVEEDLELKDSQILVAVEKFGFTSNNISYANAESLGYWEYFPSELPSWGRLPAFGYIRVIKSHCEGVQPGERFYGFVPMSSHLRMQPEDVTEHGFVDNFGNRRKLHRSYNSYFKLKGNTIGDEDLFPVLNPLYMTAWAYADFLERQNVKAEQIVILSASSKTAVATAYFLRNQSDLMSRIVGITSTRNRNFVEKADVYEAVLTYDDLQKITQTSTIVVDVSGNGSFVEAIHNRLNTNLILSSRIGNTHWSADYDDEKFQGVQPKFFFAPGHWRDRLAEWGADEFNRRMEERWLSFIAAARHWYSVDRNHGEKAVEAAYYKCLRGDQSPASATLLSLYQNDGD